jgi:hypothetical protein
MEYVYINYVTGRSVRIDGRESGMTNCTLLVEKGHHRFDLGEPCDYRPASVQRVVQNTTSLSPLVIDDFQPSVGGV